jgi:NDP-sugar pyrophosphorylase family protein
MYDEILCRSLFNLDETQARRLFEDKDYPWEVLSDIEEFIVFFGEKLDPSEYEKKGDGIWIAKSASIDRLATIKGPCIIGKHTEVRPGAFIRGKAFVGENCVVGNSTELKNVVLFNNVEVPHYNYVGDSILGFKAHMGAGSITSNIKSDRTNVTIKYKNQRIETGLRKMGAVLGDFVEVGCNSVLNPGSIIGRNSNIYPLSMIRGFIPANTIVKTGNRIVEKN